jgi:hypothetical protein
MKKNALLIRPDMWAGKGPERQTYSFSEAADLLGFGHYTFRKLLREKEVLWSGNRLNVEYARKGYLTEALYSYQPPGPRYRYSSPRTEVRITVKGIAFLKKLLAE